MYVFYALMFKVQAIFFIIFSRISIPPRPISPYRIYVRLGATLYKHYYRQVEKQNLLPIVVILS